MSGEMTACTVCGFVGYPAEMNWHKPHCRPAKPWVVLTNFTCHHGGVDDGQGKKSGESLRRNLLSQEGGT